MEIQSPRVLLVEDVRIAQKLAQMALEAIHCKVDVVLSGNEALELVEENQYDLILMDLGLPDIDGITVTETIRRPGEQNENTPIVALTAHGDELYQQECQEIGMNDYVMKPLTEEKGQALLDKFVFNKAETT